MNNKIVLLAKKAYELLAKGGDLFSNVLLLIFRLNWGLQFFHNGIGKLSNHKDIVDFFTELGIPLPDLNAWMVGGTELVGGALLVLGLASRPIALALVVMMTVAYASVKDDRNTFLNIFSPGGFWDFFEKQTDFLQADPFFFLLTALIVFAFGPGKISIDYLLGRYVFNKGKTPE